MTPREALELIAAPMRPDGTWNRDREACRQLAAAALARREACAAAERATQADALHVAYSQGVADGRATERERCAVTWDNIVASAAPFERFDDTMRRYSDAIRAGEP